MPVGFPTCGARRIHKGPPVDFARRVNQKDSAESSSVSAELAFRRSWVERSLLWGHGAMWIAPLNRRAGELSGGGLRVSGKHKLVGNRPSVAFLDQMDPVRRACCVEPESRGYTDIVESRKDPQELPRRYGYSRSRDLLEWRRPDRQCAEERKIHPGVASAGWTGCGVDSGEVLEEIPPVGFC